MPTGQGPTVLLKPFTVTAGLTKVKVDPILGKGVPRVCQWLAPTPLRSLLLLVQNDAKGR